MSATSIPRVSVILLTYNRPVLLRRAIDSVLGQSFRDFELIIVDDCSRDETRQVVQSYSDSRIVYHRHEQNRGCPGSRNTGIGLARGEFIAMQDDDDVWLPHKLATQVPVLAAAPADVGLCLAAHVRWEPGSARYIGGPRFMSVFDFSGGVIYGPNYSLITPPAWLVRRSVLQQVGGFDPRMKIRDDLEVAIRMSEVCKFIHIEEPLHLQDHVLGSTMMRNEAVLAHDINLFLEKHGHRWEKNRTLMAKHYYLMGRLESIFGDCEQARRWFRKGLSYRWFYPKLWLGWLLARMGQGWARRITSFMRDRVRPSWIGPFIYRD